LKNNGLDDDYSFCVTLQSENFGGDIIDPGYEFYDIKLSYCPANYAFCDRGSYTSLDGANGVSYIDLFYPEVFFDPNSITDPLTVRHTKSSNPYISRSYIYREIYFKKTTLLDDKGWIFQDNVNTTHITVGEQSSRS